MTTGWVTQATSRWQDIPASDNATALQLDARRLGEWLDRSVIGCQLWKSNWRNRIYRVTFGDGTEAVAKQNRIGQAHELDQEFRVLRELEQLPLGDVLRTPKPIACLREHRTYLMGFVEGTSLDVLMRRGAGSRLIDGCRRAGQSLAALHRFWIRDVCELPADELGQDLDRIPVRLSRNHRRVVDLAIDQLRGQVVPLGQPFLDFKPANVIYDGNHISLIDPPEQESDSEIMLWDLAVFSRGLRHQLFPSGILPGRQRVVTEAIDQFEQAYLAASPLAIPPRSFRLLVDLMDLQRLGQLIALQTGKCARARSSRASRVSRQITEVLCYAPLPVLRQQVRRLIRRLDASQMI